MRPDALLALGPRCPACRGAGRAPGPLALRGGWRAAPGDPARVDQGVLDCADPACGTGFPVIDGVPLLVPDLARHLADAGVYLLAREDLDDAVAATIGRHLSAGSWYDAVRQHLSTYARDHWGRFDPEETDDPPPGSTWNLIARTLEAAGAAGSGPFPGAIVDLGCAAGGIAWELADRHAEPVVAIDLSAPLARLARRALSDGEVRYPRRRIGASYAMRRFRVPSPRRSAPTVLIADALAVPLPDGAAGLVVAPNLLDCVVDPRALLREIVRLLAPGGLAVLTTPFDWSPSATPTANWTGGRRDEEDEESLTTFLRNETCLQTIAETPSMLWTVRVHNRATMTYSVRSIVAHKIVC